MSSGDGDGSPLGWLWTRTIPAALANTAALNTSLGCMVVASSEPRLTRRYPIRSLLVAKQRTSPPSHASGSSSGLITAVTSLAFLTLTGPFCLSHDTFLPYETRISRIGMAHSPGNGCRD